MRELLSDSDTTQQRSVSSATVYLAPTKKHGRRRMHDTEPKLKERDGHTNNNQPLLAAAIMS